MRTLVPEEIAAQVLYHQDHTCCVCNEFGKYVQIHRIDNDPSNHAIENLAVLCHQHHGDTQVRGGFGGTLRGAELKIYRDNWVRRVSERRQSADKIVADRLVGIPKIENVPRSVEGWFAPAPEVLSVRLNALPDILRHGYAEAGAGHTIDPRGVIHALRFSLNILQECWLRLTPWFSPENFGELSPRQYFDNFLGQMELWHRALNEPDTPGSRARQGTIELLRPTVVDAEGAIEDTVRALSSRYLPDFEYEKWQKQWLQASGTMAEWLYFGS